MFLINHSGTLGNLGSNVVFDAFRALRSVRKLIRNACFVQIEPKTPNGLRIRMVPKSIRFHSIVPEVLKRNTEYPSLFKQLGCLFAQLSITLLQETPPYTALLRMAAPLQCFG